MSVNSVATPNSTHKGMSKSLALTKTLLGGTTAMREAREAYLPKNPAEDVDFYNTRLARTVLFNGFKKTQGVLAGKVFAKGIQFTEDLVTPFDEWLKNVDLEGNSINQFGYEFFKRGLAFGVDYVLVDTPKPVPRDDGQALNAAEEKTQNIRPYLVPVLAENLIGFRSESINGIQVLVQIRIRESVMVSDPLDEFAETKVDQIRVIDIGMVRIYRKDAGGEKWVLFDEWLTTFKVIPLVPFYADRTSFMEATSPLMDLAHLNVDHWQKSSDLSNILHLIQVPILVATGVAEDQSIKVGPNTLVKFKDDSATLSFVEPTGNGTQLGIASLERIEEQMAVMGASMLVDKPGDQTATAKAINEGGSNSDLAAIAKNFEDTLNTTFALMLVVMGTTDDSSLPQAQMNTDYGVAGNGAITTDELLKIRMAGEISHETFIARLNELTGFDINAEE